MHPCWIHPLLIFCKSPQLVPLTGNHANLYIRSFISNSRFYQQTLTHPHFFRSYEKTFFKILADNNKKRYFLYICHRKNLYIINLNI